MKIPFNRPFMTGRELAYIARAHERGQLAGDGIFTKKCHHWLEERTGCKKALLTHSCTASLEMAAILANVEAGDEVIMPSYTFVSTANAFVLRGAVPVFVDIREDTLNIDENLIEEAITERTRAIVVVHYAGVACEMDAIMELARRHDLLVIEDAAQGILCSYKGRPLGSLGDFGALSFHETKNVISGEGGALLINRPEFSERAEIIREKGTNRSQFFRGEIDKYTWVDIGSSFLPSEMVAAFLQAQLEDAERITEDRMEIWKAYHSVFEAAESEGRLRRPVVPEYCDHSAHIYFLLLPNQQTRDQLIREMSQRDVQTVFHYVPLHASPMGSRVGRVSGSMNHTEQVARRLIRLPIWLGYPDIASVVSGRLLDSLDHLR